MARLPPGRRREPGRRVTRRTPPLLLLAEGRRTRPRKAPVDRPRELALHMAVVDALAKLGDSAWRWTHFPAGEHRDVRTAAKLKRMGVKRGWPDIILVSPAGAFHGLELKRDDKAELTEDQELFRFWSVRGGIRYAVVSTLDEALATLAGWHVIRPLAS